MSQAEDFPPLERLFSCPQWLEAAQAQAPKGWTQRTLPRLKLRVALPPKTRVTMESDRVDLRTEGGQVAVSLRRQRGQLGKDAHAAMIDIRQLEVGPSLCNRACLERAEANLRQASGWSSAALTISGRPLAEPRRWIAGVFEDSHGLMTVIPGNIFIKPISSKIWCVAPSSPKVNPAWEAHILTFLSEYAID